MAVDRDPQNPTGYMGIYLNQHPKLVVADRAPTSNDRRGHKIGTPWVNKSTNAVYMLTSVSGSTVNWEVLGSPVAAISTINSNAPVSGNYNLVGGTNITVAETSGTTTFNLDDAITLATSVTSALYTAAAATDLLITAPTGQDAVLKLGDAAGANKLSITDSGDAEVALIDSDGGATFNGNVVLNGAATQLQVQGGAVTDFIGTATLTAGTVTIANTNIAAGDRIFIQRQDVNSSTAIGNLVYTISAATSFTITSVQDAAPGTTETNDVSIVMYFIVREI